jgi:hypothetical protein
MVAAIFHKKWVIPRHKAGIALLSGLQTPLPGHAKLDCYKHPSKHPCKQNFAGVNLFHVFEGLQIPCFVPCYDTMISIGIMSLVPLQTPLLPLHLDRCLNTNEPLVYPLQNPMPWKCGMFGRGLLEHRDFNLFLSRRRPWKTRRHWSLHAWRDYFSS